MQVVLGSSTYDVSCRALVIAVVDPSPDDAAHGQQAESLVALGADALAIDATTGTDAATAVTELRRRVDVPIVVASSENDVALAAAREGASVLMAAGAVAAAIAAGVPAGAILLDAGDQVVVHPEPAQPVVVSTHDAAAHAVAIVCGGRLLRTRDVRGARRVADVMAAVFEAAARPGR